MLLQIAIGDAYGAGFEFAPRAKIARHNDGVGYVGHEKGIPPGHYTDDTQMSLAIAELLLAEPAPDAAAFAQAFVATYRRDPRPGYSDHFARLLAAVDDGAALRARIDPRSVRNGAAMRSVPLGLLADLPTLRATAHLQAAITHDTPEGRVSSEVVALMAHGLLYRGLPVADLPGFVAAQCGFALRADWRGEVEVHAIQTVHAVNTALQRNGSLTALLRDCIEFGGDVDSVAAIALGLGALAPTIEDDLAPSLHAGLEDAAYGRAWLLEIDRRLAARFPALARRPAG